MKFVNCGLSGDEREPLVRKIEELTGEKAVYLGMPSMAYHIGPFRLDAEGRLSWDENADNSGPDIVKALEKEGFIPQQETHYVKDDAEEYTAFPISISLEDDLSDIQFENFEEIVLSKESLFKMAFNTDTVEIVRSDGKITFPWLKAEDQIHAGSYFIFATLLTDKARIAWTVNDAPVQAVNPKDQMENFLLQIGMTGNEYKDVRKIILENVPVILF